MNKSKKLLSLLLTLAMVLALLGGSFAFADEAEEPAEPMPFTKTDGFVMGEQVLLVAELDGKSNWGKAELINYLDSQDIPQEQKMVLYDLFKG